MSEIDSDTPVTPDTKEAEPREPTISDDAKSFADEMRAALAENEEPVVQGEKKGSTTPAPAQVTIESLKALARDGKFEDISKALGVDPAQFEIPAKRFAAFRAQHKALKAEASQLAEHKARIDQYAQKLQDQYAPVYQAAKAIQEGDFEEALKLMTGGKIDGYTFAKALAEQDSVSDPVARRELRKLREEQAQLKKEREEHARIQQQRDAQLLEQQEVEGVKTDMGKLSAVFSEDEELGVVAQDTRFLALVAKSIKNYVRNGGHLPSDPDDLRSEVLEYSKRILLDLRDQTAKLHGAPKERTAPARVKAAETVAQGTRPTIRRASPAAPLDTENESLSDTASRFARMWEVEVAGS